MSVSNSGKIGTRRGVKLSNATQEEYNKNVGSGMCSIVRAVHPRPNLAASIDPVEHVKGMYRLLDLISESGSNGYGMKLPLGTKPFEQQFGLIS